jgi:transposase InsO family protein
MSLELTDIVYTSSLRKKGEPMTPDTAQIDVKFIAPLKGSRWIWRILKRLDMSRLPSSHGLFNDRLKEWEDFYNFNRPHGALGGQTPYERLREKTRGSV